MATLRKKKGPAPAGRTVKKGSPFRWCELPFCAGMVQGNGNKKRCDPDRNIHLHKKISSAVRRIMAIIEGRREFTAQEVNETLFKGKLDKNDKGSLYRLLQAMIREGYCQPAGDRDGIKLYRHNRDFTVREDRFDLASRNRNIATPREGTTPRKRAIPSPVGESTKGNQDPLQKLKSRLHKFIVGNKGQYGHREWLALLSDEVVVQSKLHPDQIGMLLEGEKRRFFSEN